MFTPTFFSNEVFLQIGGGAKIYLNDTWFVSPEARIGWEPHLRLSVGLGIRSGGSYYLAPSDGYLGPLHTPIPKCSLLFTRPCRFSSLA